MLLVFLKEINSKTCRKIYALHSVRFKRENKKKYTQRPVVLN